MIAKLLTEARIGIWLASMAGLYSIGLFPGWLLGVACGLAIFYILASASLQHWKEGRTMDDMQDTLRNAVYEFLIAFLIMVGGSGLSVLLVEQWPHLSDYVTGAWYGAAIASGFLALVRWIEKGQARGD